ncbi:hypothetical protein TorRG33x02_118260 [Trema orientale]|uniref:Uncharacterized protein n=1 Tax=Trema orientale TaxID=63057 RepID=A0A2P5F411_TREOI|nr:hypothetical protein TorRG33x02_118260 [Trema orientale]
MSTSPPLKLEKNPSAFLILAASVLSDRTNSGSKRFDLASDDVLCLYEDCGNYDSSNGSHSDPVVRAIDCPLLRILGFAYSTVIFIDDNIYIYGSSGFILVVFAAANRDRPSSPPGQWWKTTPSPPYTSSLRSLPSGSTWFNLGR